MKGIWTPNFKFFLRKMLIRKFQFSNFETLSLKVKLFFRNPYHNKFSHCREVSWIIRFVIKYNEWVSKKMKFYFVSHLTFKFSHPTESRNWVKNFNNAEWSQKLYKQLFSYIWHYQRLNTTKYWHKKWAKSSFLQKGPI